MTAAAPPDDLLADISALPDVPPSHVERHYERLYCLDDQGFDQYCYLIPNGLCVVGLAPSHALLRHQHEAGQPQPPAAPEPPAASEAAPTPCEDPLTEPERPAADGLASPSGATAGPLGGTGKRPARPHRNVAVFPSCDLAAVNFNVGRRDKSNIKASGKKQRAEGIPYMQPDSVLCRIESKGGASVPVRAIVGGKLLEINQQLLKDPGLLFRRPSVEGYIAILSPSKAELQTGRAKLLTDQKYMEARGLTRQQLR